MLKFILRRCLEAIPTLFILITISFFMMRLAPGSPFTGERTLPPEVMANIEAKYHLNDPIMTQYFNYLKQLAHGDFGPSFKYKDYSVNDLVASSFPVSAKLGLAAFLLAVILGVSAGVIAALKQNTKWDYAVMGVAMTGVVIPSFVVAPLLVMIFAITLHWLPGGGWNGGALKFMILPMVALSLAFFNRDYRKVAELHVDSGWVPADTNVEDFEFAIRTVCEPIFEKPLAEISFGHVLLNLFNTARRFNMEVQPQLVLLQKTLL